MNTIYTIQDCILIDVTTFTDERGSLSVLENAQPFAPKRIFWMHHIAAGADRGAHAMLEGSEVLVAVHGSFMVDLDDGVSKTSVLLNDPTKGLLLRPGICSRTHSYKDNCVPSILADEEYDRGKYVYEYGGFTIFRGLREITEERITV